MLIKIFALLTMLLSLSQQTLDAYVDQMNLGGNLILINREFMLSEDYVPDDLVRPDVNCLYSNIKMRAEAAEALKMMFDDAKEEGYRLVAVSGYRSYGQQTNIFNRKVKSVGREKARLVVADPGASEHQLGLAMDLGSRENTSLSSSFGATEAGKWVNAHCYEYGFIIRYKEEWTDITGYDFEPWHVRYVGREHAIRIRDLDIPLEYYVQTLREAQYAALTGKE